MSATKGHSYLFIFSYITVEMWMLYIFVLPAYSVHIWIMCYIELHPVSYQKNVAFNTSVTTAYREWLSFCIMLQRSHHILYKVHCRENGTCQQKTHGIPFLCGTQQQCRKISSSVAAQICICSGALYLFNTPTGMPSNKQIYK